LSNLTSLFHHPDPLPSTLYPLPSSKMDPWSLKGNDRRVKKEKRAKDAKRAKERYDKAKRRAKKKDLKTGTVSGRDGLRGPLNQKKPDAKKLLCEALGAM